MKAIYPETLQAIHRMLKHSTKTSKSDPHYVGGLTSVKISATDAPDTIHLEASDGYFLSRISLKDPGFYAELGQNSVVYLDHVNLPVIALMLKKSNDYEISKDDAGKFSISCDGLIVPLLNTTNFPETDSLIPNPLVENTFTVTVNPELLVKFLASVREHNWDNFVSLTLDVTKPMDTIFVQCGESGTGIVMPARSGRNKAIERKDA